MKIYLKIFSVLFLAIGLVACGGTKKGSSSEQEDTKSTFKKLASADQFPDQFLAGNFEALYEQTSDTFQAKVPLKQFINLGEGFNKGVDGYQLVSKIPIQNMIEYQWISEKGDKGIRSYFADDLTIEGLQLLPITSYPESDEQYTENTYRMPVTEKWFTFWGGTNELVNYHYVSENQRYAYDLVMMNGDTSFKGDPANNESYYAFGKEVVAPRGGVVVSVENAIPDNTPTVDTNTEEPLGNHVIIEHENNEYSVIAHLREGSLKIVEGDKVSANDLVGLVGNSGNSSEPHIHFHVVDSPKWKEATSIRIKFANGIDPVRGDIVTGF
ncbi:peptidoglycan DD-metalloendopeptidase family protein [Virgibacillus sp. FSP13]